MTLEGYRRDALVHHSQISEDLNLGRDEDDEDKITALEYFCRPGSEVSRALTNHPRKLRTRM